MNPLSDNYPWTMTTFQRQVYLQTTMENGARRLESDIFNAKQSKERRNTTLMDVVIPHLAILAHQDVEQRGTEYDVAMNALIRYHFPSINTRRFIKRHLNNNRQRQQDARPSSPVGEDVTATTWDSPPASVVSDRIKEVLSMYFA
ncbi:hypothetical protein [Absidia glauca]|uniref:Uncharacterized protein n=1 Tax=Absidia glauca TaxID=4829 RepID=A0A163J3G6_ABSGL|nr:hypothetical protein [Absidia glauca]